jgi:hypothetical protein
MMVIAISSSSSLSYICHGAGPLVDPFWSHVSRSLFKDKIVKLNKNQLDAHLF